MDWDTRFGAFRQLLHTGVQAPRDLHQLLDLVDDAFLTDPDRYLEQWVGYAASLPSHTPPVIGCGSVSEFLFWSERAPFARFDVAFDRDARLRDEFDALASSPQLGSLRSLSTSHCRLGPEGAQAIADLDGLSNLESLDLSGGRIAHDGLAALSESGLLAGLSRLHVTRCDLDIGSTQVLSILASCRSLRHLSIPSPSNTAQLERLLALESFSNLESLRLSSERSAEGDPIAFAHVLANAPHLMLLERLELRGFGGSFGPATMRVLLESDELLSLTTVLAGSMDAPDTRAECDAFFATPRAQSLTHLDVGYESAPILTALAEAEPLESLRDLYLEEPTVDELDALADWPGLRHVTSLHLPAGRGRYTDHGTIRFFQSPHTRALREVVLPRWIDLGEYFDELGGAPSFEGLEALTVASARIDDVPRLRDALSSPILTDLHTLLVSFQTASDEALELLLGHEHFTSLRTLRIYADHLAANHLDALRQTPWFDGLEDLVLVIPFPWRASQNSKLPRSKLPHTHRDLLERGEGLVHSLAEGPLPSRLANLRVSVMDHRGEPLVPKALVRLLARPELSHAARHGLLAPLDKRHLVGLAATSRLKRTNRLDRYELIETLRRFVMARNAPPA